MVNKPRNKGTKGEVATLPCLQQVWPRMKRASTVEKYGNLPDYFDLDDRCPWAWEHKFSPQQRLKQWWAQAKKCADKLGLIPGLIWKQDGRPANDPWVIFTWTEFAPVAQFIDLNLAEFRMFLHTRDEADRQEDSEVEATPAATTDEGATT